MKFSRFFLAVACSVFVVVSCGAPYQKRTDEAIKAVMEEFQVVGLAATAVKDGKIVYNKSFGYKDIDQGTPLENGDIVRIASVSKSFVATALMQYVDKGVITLDDDVSDLIGFKVRNPHHPDIPITLKMILSHTSSIKDKEDDYFTLSHLPGRVV